METQKPNIEPPEQPKPKWFLNHKFLYSVIGILLLIVIATSVALHQTAKRSPGPGEPCIPTVVRNLGTDEYVGLSGCGTEITNSTWKTYTNTEYGFELKYPNGWLINFQDHILTLKFISPASPNQPEGILVIAPTGGYKINPNYDFPCDVEQDVTFAGQNAKQCVHEAEFYFHKSIQIRDKIPNWSVNNIIDYDANKPEGEDSYNLILMGEKILSTFKLTSINTPTVSENGSQFRGWQTYKSTQNNFEISYPQDWYAEKCNFLNETVLIGNSQIGSASCGDAGPPLNSETKYDGNVSVQLTDYIDINKAINEYASLYKDPSQTKIIVSGQESTKIEGIYKRDAKYHTDIILTDTILAYGNGKVFVLSNDIQAPGYSKTFDDIVTTFKFR